MSIKIQINSLAALERLIGGDSELEIELRQSVVEAFARKHLKVVVNSEVFKEAVDGIRASLEGEVGKVFGEELKRIQGKFFYNAYPYELSPEWKKIVRERVQQSCGPEFEKEVKKQIEILTSPKGIQNLADMVKKHVAKKIMASM